jgi:hypothetical protein
MIKYNPNIPLISIHIPKTAGTTFKYILQKWYGKKLHLHYADENQLPKQVSLTNFFGKEKRNFCIHGHFNRKRLFGIEHYYPEVKQYVCFLRDPLDLQISTYKYKINGIKNGKIYWDWPVNNPPEDIDTFLEEYPSNMLLHLPKEIDLHNYKDVINNLFIHVGIVERYDDSLKIISACLNKVYVKSPVLNSTELTISPSKKSIRIFEEKHELEYKLYEYARKINDV